MAGIYAFNNIKNGTYKLKIVSSIFVLYEQSYIINKPGMTTINVQLTPATWLIQGQLKDAISGLALAGIFIQLQLNSNIVSTTTTDSNGNYKLNCTSPSTYNIIASKTGYITYNQQFTINTSGITYISFQLTPEFSEYMRIVCSWGDHPNDLELSAKKPNGVIIDYRNKNDASMTKDRDWTAAYGPETLTLMFNCDIGTYKIYVDNWADRPGYGTSNTKIVIYVYDGTQYSWSIPTTIADNQNWYVCDLIINSNTNWSINTVNKAINGIP